MSDYVRHLFPYINHDLLKIWSCGHIIPKDNLVVWPVAKGLDDFELDFTYSNRKSSAIMHSLGISLVKLLVIIPDGVVVFFPSYSYLDQVVLSWQKDGIGTSGSIWNHLSKQKPIFREFKDVVGTGDLLEDYARAVDSGKGGLLLSVIGGKMSEGINFSDRLGRGVVVVGLPFPNIQSAQWKAKLEYIEKTAVDQGKSRDESKAASREFYENACMRAVNQSIGRAIRHRNDFASIILLDRRYQTPRILEKLPGWIQQSLVQSKRNVHFQSALQGLEAFFRGKG